MLKFIRSFVGVKADDAVAAGIRTLVELDPQGATEAELRTMEQELDKLGRQVAEARLSFDKEKKEADTIQALYNTRLAAAEKLASQFEAETDPAKKAGLEKSLGTLLTMAEEMAPEIAREVEESKDAEDFLGLLQTTYNDAGAKLKGARSALATAQRDMQRADQQRQQAERQAEVARQAAGLSKVTNGLDVALGAMRKSADNSRAEADAQLAKAKLLAPTAPEKDDPNIAAALKAASGALPGPTSPGDRLAALRAKTA